MDSFLAPSRDETPVVADVAFSERAFFLRAFQGICLTFVLAQNSDLDPSAVAVLQKVLQEVITQAGETGGEGGKVLLLFQDTPAVASRLEPLLAALAPQVVRLCVEDPHRVPPVLWQSAPYRGRPPLVAMGVVAESLPPFEETVLTIGLVLRMSRLVWVDGAGGITDANGQLLGFFNSARLADRVREGQDTRTPLLAKFQALLAGGVKAISLCRLADLEQELFTYQGLGSFFSRHPYCRVRRLGLDDFEHTAAIIRRGEQEGFLLPRSEAAISEILAGSYGAFILEDRLAGICALETVAYRAAQAGEIVSLYLLTRFQGVGVGGQLLRHVVQDAQRQGLASLFACTRHERVAEFFLRCRFGRHRLAFQRVEADQVPREKWHAYDPERKKQIICLHINLGELS
ncbi:MAG: GNAT family N-acetyltransferase [Magnetococcales bacterium]|nr:GNAT family N-acetyltransferase [Magnetococcales bacterium]